MVRPMLTVFVRLPDVPVTVTVAGPEAAEAAAEKVRVQAPVALGWLNLAVTPFGNPETVSATGELNPVCGFTEIELEAEPPCATATVAGVAVRLNVGIADTVSAMVAV